MKIIKLEHKPEYLQIEIGGEFNLTAAKEIAGAIISESSAHDIKSVLIDARNVSGEFSILERYIYGKYVSNFNIRVAIVTNEAMTLPDKFFENVVINSGGALIVTTDTDTAMRWLGVS